MPSHEVKNMSDSSEIRKFENAKIELVNVAGGTVGRFVLQEGWKWSNDIKPIVKTEWCEAPHIQYVISGKYRVKMKDGTEFDIGLEMWHQYRLDTMHGSSATSRL